MLPTTGVSISRRPVAHREGQGLALEVRLPRDLSEGGPAYAVPVCDVWVSHRIALANGSTVLVAELPLASALLAPSGRSLRLRPVGGAWATPGRGQSLGSYLQSVRDGIRSYDDIADSLRAAHLDPAETTINSPISRRPEGRNGSFAVYLYVAVPIAWKDMTESQYLHVRTHISSRRGANSGSSSSLACFVASVRWGTSANDSSGSNTTDTAALTASESTVDSSSSNNRRLQHELRSAHGNILSSAVSADHFFTSNSSSNRRRLTDTYASSLIHVNRIYTKMLGADNRKVGGVLTLTLALAN